MRKLKRILVVLFMVLTVFAGYVAWVNRDSKDMTLRQKILKAAYPALVWWTKLRGKNVTILENEHKQPAVSFFSLKTILNDGTTLDFATLKGKKVMLVNTASNCGYTDQYTLLEKLFEQHIDQLIVIGFPANDFKEQEKGTDQEIARFCKKNFGIRFPLAKKSSVKKGPEQNEVYRWLTDSSLNGWNGKPPSWNFCKYLVDETGVLTHYFGPSISPESEEVLKAIEKK